MELRPYQNEARNKIHEAWDTADRTLLVLPTGTGKTIVFAHLTADLVRQGKRVLILAHRGELLEQARDKIYSATGLTCALEKAENSCMGAWERVVVGSVQTLQSEKRLKTFRPDYFHNIIVDEAHHVLADSYMRILDHFGGAKVLGVTSTPDRGDMRNLGHYFQSLAYDYSLPRAIRDGFLCKIKAVTVPLKIELNGCAVQAGDLKASDVGNVLLPYLDKIADHMLEHCRGRKTVVFLPLIQTSKKMQEILNEKGLICGEVNGESKDRAEVLRDFDAGKYDVLCNSMLLTEGWDCPTVDCIVCLRPTKIRSLYAQIVGRGTRPLADKDHLLLLDFLWHIDRHSLCRPAHLIATSEDVAQKMTQKLEEDGTALDLQEIEEEAEKDCVHDREIALAEKLREMRRKKQKLVDPLQYEMSILDKDLSGYVPTFGWECQPVSEKQAGILEKLGIFPDPDMSAGKATLILDKLSKRRDAGLTTPKQIRFLERSGFQHVGQWSFDAASKMISRIHQNGWRVPLNIDTQTYVPE